MSVRLGWQRDIHGENTIGPKAGIRLKKPHKTADQEPRPNQEHKRQGKFRRNEKSLETMMRPGSCCAAPTFLQSTCHGRERRAKGRDKAENRPGQKGCSCRESQHAFAQRDATRQSDA